jgi:hypothetical protein
LGQSDPDAELREDGEGCDPVRAELKAEGVKIGVKNGELCRIIADVQRVFRAPRTREHADEEVPPGIDAGTMGRSLLMNRSDL